MAHEYHSGLNLTEGQRNRMRITKLEDRVEDLEKLTQTRIQSWKDQLEEQYRVEVESVKSRNKELTEINEMLSDWLLEIIVDGIQSKESVQWAKNKLKNHD